MKNLHLILLSSMLLAVGLGIFIYKYQYLDLPLTPDKTSNIWDIEIRISFLNENKSSKVDLFIPVESHNFNIISEYFHSGKYGLVTKKREGNRQANWSIRKTKGKQNLYYRATIQKLESKGQEEPSLKKTIRVTPPALDEPYLNAAKALWNEIYEHSSDLDSVIGHLFRKLDQPAADENVALLLGDHKDSTIRKIETAVQVLSLAGIPARPVHGFELEEETLSVEMVHWLEVYHQKKWWEYCPGKESSDLPESYIAWWRGTDPLYKVRGENPQIHITAQKKEMMPNRIAQKELVSAGLLKFSLLNLPTENQGVYRMMLLIPLGALLVVIFRNFIGIKTFGTFMPVLIALAFRETQLLWGVIFFSLIVALGLVVRFYLENLKLLVVPRLSAVLVTVIIILIMLNVVSHNMGLSLGLSVSLFPIVILSMTIERMSVLWEERGADEAIRQGIGTLFVSILTYFIFANYTLEHVMLIFPELLLVLLAVMILMGRYSGFRLLELYRFRELGRDNK